MATGTAILDFGAFPGKSDASVDVIGQAAIVAGSLVEAWIRPVDTADHSADEHMVETLKVIAGNIVAGVGFTVYGFNTSQLNEGLEHNGAGRAATSVVGAQTGTIVPTKGGIGTRIYGQWTIAWAWS